MENETLTLNATKLLPGIMPPQAIEVILVHNHEVDGESIKLHLFRINGPIKTKIAEGDFEAVARTLLRISTGAVPSFELPDMQLITNENNVILTTPGSGTPIEFSRGGVEELACRLIVLLRETSGTLLNTSQKGMPINEIPIGKLINNRIPPEVDIIDLF